MIEANFTKKHNKAAQKASSLRTKQVENHMDNPQGMKWQFLAMQTIGTKIANYDTINNKLIYIPQ